ncbi:MAG: DUF2232 domain-containing protein [Bacillota bacterium]|nr:DUF2232 domain-containing protein [Bacillota bacterium]
MKEKGANLKFLPVIAAYLGLAYFVSEETGLYFTAYSLLPPSLVYLFYKNEQRNLKLFSAGFLLVLFLFVRFDAKLALFFYAVMAFAAALIIDKSQDGMFKKLITLILVMILFSLGLFVVLEQLRGGPSFFEALNQSLSDPAVIEQVNQILKDNMGEQAIDFSSIDKTSLKIGISSFISIIVLDLVGFVSTLNFWIIAHIMRAKNPAIDRLKPIWEMYLPKKFTLILFFLLIVSYFLISVMGNFAFGIVVTLVILLFQLYNLQGIFVLSFFLNKTRMPIKFHIPALIAIVIAISLTKIGAFLLFNVGVIDAVFNLRKISRGSHEG